MSAAVPLYRRVVTTCGTCRADHDEQGYRSLRKLRHSHLAPGVTAWWAECDCGSGVVAVERAGVWLTDAEAAVAIAVAISRGER